MTLKQVFLSILRINLRSGLKLKGLDYLKTLNPASLRERFNPTMKK